MTGPDRRLAGLAREGLVALLTLALHGSALGDAAVPAPAIGPEVTSAAMPGTGLPLFFAFPGPRLRAPVLGGAVAPLRSLEASGTTRQADRQGARLSRPGRRRLIITSAALAASGALAARWSKARADRAYDRYLRSAGPARRERALDRAEQYDRLAGAGFLAMEAGLAACTYFVFF